MSSNRLLVKGFIVRPESRERLLNSATCLDWVIVWTYNLDFLWKKRKSKTKTTTRYPPFSQNKMLRYRTTWGKKDCKTNALYSVQDAFILLRREASLYRVATLCVLRTIYQSKTISVRYGKCATKISIYLQVTSLVRANESKTVLCLLKVSEKRSLCTGLKNRCSRSVSMSKPIAVERSISFFRIYTAQ